MFVSILATVALLWECVVARSTPGRRQEPVRPKETKLDTNADNILTEALRLHRSGTPADAYAFLLDKAGSTPADARIAHEMGRLSLDLRNPVRARRHLECAHELAPRDARIANDLGRALNNSRDLPTAEQWFRLAVRLDPAWHEAHLNLGHVLRAVGRSDEALQAFVSALELAPDSARAHCDAATVYADIGQSGLALDHYRHAVRLEPDWGMACLQLGLSLHAAGQYEEAIDALRRATRLMPQAAEAHSSLGSALQSEGEFDAAESCFREALRIDPELAPARAALASVLSQTGRGDAACAQLMPALQRDDADPILLVALANMEPDHALASRLIERLLRLARSRQIDRMTQALIHFSLGDLLDTREDYASAFRHYSHGNALRRTRFNRHDLPEYSRQLIRLLDTTGETAQAEGFTPVFIVGMPRSGTSLVEQILASHPDIAAAGEQRALALAVRSELTIATVPTVAAVAGLRAATLTRMAGHYRRALAGFADGRHLCTDKMWQNFEYLWLIRRVFPGARIVHCVRDPLAIGLSCFCRSFGVAGPPFANDLQDIAAYQAHFEAIMDTWLRAPESPTLTVRYEELVDDLEGRARELIEFAGVDWDPACLRFYKNKRTVRTASHAQVTKPIYRSSLARWRNYERELLPLAEALREAGIENALL